jgi:hypothetical protein
MAAHNSESANSESANSESASYDVGYGKPPRHTQFQKGRSGNPGGRPPRDPANRLKDLTLQEAYRTVVVRRPDGVVDPVQAVRAVLRSQIELAMNGNVRAQRDILFAVRTFELQESRESTLEASLEAAQQKVADLEAALEEAEKRAPPPQRKVSIHEAARRIRLLLQLDKAEREAAKTEAAKTEGDKTEADKNDACALAKETAGEDRGEEAASAVATEPRPENGAAPAAPPVASTRLADARPARPPSGRRARHRAQEPAPPAGADLRPRVLRNRCVRHRTGDAVLPFNVTWKQLVSRHGQRQKSRNSLLSSQFSGNPDAGRAEGAKPRRGRMSCSAPHPDMRSWPG